MSFLPQELIRKKRDGGALTLEEIAFIVQAITHGRMADEQIGAFAMAVFFRGMSLEERIALTCAMRDSGSKLDWRLQDLGKPVVDKHSTGGVGDKVSLMLAPIVAACGAAVPMISGRGLGHTGGTLDKLGAIPGYDAFPSPETFVRVTKEIGCAIIGQTHAMAPADKKLYAIRDVTATVESIALITASILSKKLAAGLDALVMDVKFGSGAFATTLDEARELAESLVTVAKGAGCRARALLTDMNQVLGTSAGNAVEVVEAIEYLTGKRREARLHGITLALAAEMLLATKIATSAAEAEAKVKTALDSGAAAEVFARMATALGGPANLLDVPHRSLPLPERSVDIFAPRAGVVTSINVREIGLTIVALGGGRTRSADSIDPLVGITEIVGLGAAVGPDQPLARVHVRTEAQAERAAAMLRAAFHIGDTPPAPRSILADRVI